MCSIQKKKKWLNVDRRDETGTKQAAVWMTSVVWNDGWVRRIKASPPSVSSLPFSFAFNQQTLISRHGLDSIWYLQVHSRYAFTAAIHTSLHRLITFWQQLFFLRLACLLKRVRCQRRAYVSETNHSFRLQQRSFDQYFTDVSWMDSWNYPRFLYHSQVLAVMTREDEEEGCCVAPVYPPVTTIISDTAFFCVLCDDFYFLYFLEEEYNWLFNLIFHRLRCFRYRYPRTPDLPSRACDYLLFRKLLICSYLITVYLFALGLMRLMPFRLRRTALRVGVTVTAAAVRPPEVLGDNGGGGSVSSGWEEEEGTVLGGIDAEATNPPPSPFVSTWNNKIRLHMCLRTRRCLSNHGCQAFVFTLRMIVRIMSLAESPELLIYLQFSQSFLFFVDFVCSFKCQHSPIMYRKCTSCMLGWPDDDAVCCCFTRHPSLFWICKAI